MTSRTRFIGRQAVLLALGSVVCVSCLQFSDTPVAQNRPAPGPLAKPQAKPPRSVPVRPVSDPGAVAATNPLVPARAYGYLGQICALGPRLTGSPGMAAQQKLLATHFEALGGKVSWQRFHVRHQQTGKPVPAANLLVEWHPQKKERVLLCVHYDTRPVADNPRVPAAQRGGDFIGANDGASGAALLMELAHQMPRLTSRYGVDFLLVDAEEFMFENDADLFFVGSRYFAREYVAQPPPHRYRWGVVLDMIGDRRLQIYQERNSTWWRDTRPLVDDIWATAKRLGVREFIAKKKHSIRDDHLMLRNVGKIPTCSVIDFDYPKSPKNVFWHTAADTPDKCSGESLAKVGWVMLEWIKNAE